MRKKKKEMNPNIIRRRIQRGKVVVKTMMRMSIKMKKMNMNSLQRKVQVIKREEMIMKMKRIREMMMTKKKDRKVVIKDLQLLEVISQIQIQVQTLKLGIE